MLRITSIALLVATLLWPSIPAHAYSLQFTNSSAAVSLRWPASTVTVAFSSSLYAPPSNIKPGSDVVGAARRALARWSEAADIDFIETSSDAQLLANDGVNLMTVATGNSFSSAEQPGRTRLSFNTATGAIIDADIAINPNVAARDASGQLAPSFFSTDGTPGSYDLEATFVHEIGHLLGLEHSGVVGASMQPRQGRNSLYDLSGLTARTLASDDRAGVRAIYGPTKGTGTIAGIISYAGGGGAAFGAHVWAEESTTGRVRGGNIALADGRYRIDGLPPGQYRVIAEHLAQPIAVSEIASRKGAYAGLDATIIAPFVTTETTAPIAVAPNTSTVLNINVLSGQQFVNPTLLGANDQLSTVAVPLVPGRTLTVLVGGENVHQVPSGGISVTSPFVTVDQSSVTQQAFGATQVLRFNVTVDVAAPPGEYSIRLQASFGQVAYLTGGLTVDLPGGMTHGMNPMRDDGVFIAQHYQKKMLLERVRHNSRASVIRARRPALFIADDHKSHERIVRQREFVDPPHLNETKARAAILDWKWPRALVG